MKKHHLIENLTFVLFVNIIQFVTTYYLHRISGEYRVSDIIFDVIFTVLYAVFFVTVFFRNKTLFSGGAMKLHGEKDKKR